MSLTTCPDCGNPISGLAVSCPKCGRPLRRASAPAIAVAAALGLGVLAALGVLVLGTGARGLGKATYHRAVHSGQREQVAFFYSLRANCDVEGYPEITIVRGPARGSVSTEQGKAYPQYTRDNIRFECDRSLAGATLVFYQSAADFRGHDSFTIAIRFPDSTQWTQSFAVDVM